MLIFGAIAASRAIKGGRNLIEFGRCRTQAVGRRQKNAQPIGDVERLGGRLHRIAVAHEQRIGKLPAQTLQHLADCRLRRFHRMRGPGDATQLEQRIENAQFAQTQLRICLLSHSNYSRFGMVEVLIPQ
jgi:hypothetical protein